jgi:hypothetical protein
MNRSSRAPDPDVVASTLGSSIWKSPPGRGTVYAACLASTVSISAQEGQRKTSSSGSPPSFGMMRATFMVCPQWEQTMVESRVPVAMSLTKPTSANRKLRYPSYVELRGVRSKIFKRCFPDLRHLSALA